MKSEFLFLNFEGMMLTMQVDIKKVHVFIIWNTALNKKDEILSVIKTKFKILKALNVKWSDELFFENLTSFYEENLQNKLLHTRERGLGSMLAIIAYDEEPVFYKQHSRRGIELVNGNALYVKQFVRENITHTFNFHSSINETETRNNIMKLTGKSAVDFFASTKLDDDILDIERNCPGVGGWESLNELFYTLNECCKYAVLRGFNKLPSTHKMIPDGDIDILVEHLPSFLCILEPNKLDNNNAFQFFNWLDINNDRILIHPKFVGDNYYDSALQQRILDNRILNSNKIYVPDTELYFWSLLYHGLIHKENYLKYTDELELIAGQLGIHWINEKEYLCFLVSDWLKRHNYDCKLHLDSNAAMLQPQNMRSGITDKSYRPRIYCYLLFRDDQCIISSYISEKLIYLDGELFSRLIAPLDPLFDLRMHTLDPRSKIYDELIRNSENGEVFWRYSIRFDKISKMTVSFTSEGKKRIDKKFLDDSPYARGTALTYFTEEITEFYNGVLCFDKIAQAAATDGFDSAFDEVKNFVSVIINNYSIEAGLLDPVVWDLVPKNCIFDSEGQYKFFDFEARYNTPVPLEYYLFIISHQVDVWREGEVKQKILFELLCKHFKCMDTAYDDFEDKYQAEINEIITPCMLKDDDLYRFYFYPHVINDEIFLTSRYSILEKEKDDLSVRLDVQSEVQSIVNSLSFRIGRAITFPLRFIRDLIR